VISLVDYPQSAYESESEFDDFDTQIQSDEMIPEWYDHLDEDDLFFHLFH
jgi:hypothetical protein